MRNNLSFAPPILRTAPLLTMALVFAVAAPSAATDERQNDRAENNEKVDAEKRTSVVVMEPIDESLSAAEKVAVGDRLGADLAIVRGFSVATSADIRAVLDLETNRQLLGCDEESCLSEIADAMGADIVVSWRRAPVGEETFVSVTLFDRRKGRAVGRGRALVGDLSLVGAGAAALRDALDAFLRSTLDPHTRALETYQTKVLWVVGEDGDRIYQEGEERIALSDEAFFSRVGRDDLGKQTTAYKTAKALSFWVPIGVSFGVLPVAGAASGLGIVALLGPANFTNLFDDESVLRGLSAFIIGASVVAMTLLLTPGILGLGLGTGIVASFLQEAPTTWARDAQLAKKHNIGLARRLGLRPDEVDVE